MKGVAGADRGPCRSPFLLLVVTGYCSSRPSAGRPLLFVQEHMGEEGQERSDLKFPGPCGSTPILDRPRLRRGMIDAAHRRRTSARYGGPGSTSSLELLDIARGR